MPDAVDTYVWAMNDSGALTGLYYGTGIQAHGYVRDQFGNITTFDPPNSVNTYPQTINDAGEVVGFYTPTGQIASDFFIRNVDGSFTTFAIPNGNAGAYSRDSIFLGFNSLGEIVGSEATMKGAFGWSRSPTGTFTEYSFCGTSTALSGINDVGWTVGYCGDSSFEGFISQ